MTVGSGEVIAWVGVFCVSIEFLALGLFPFLDCCFFPFMLLVHLAGRPGPDCFPPYQ